MVFLEGAGSFYERVTPALSTVRRRDRTNIRARDPGLKYTGYTNGCVESTNVLLAVFLLLTSQALYEIGSTRIVPARRPLEAAMMSGVLMSRARPSISPPLLSMYLFLYRPLPPSLILFSHTHSLTRSLSPPSRASVYQSGLQLSPAAGRNRSCRPLW